MTHRDRLQAALSTHGAQAGEHRDSEGRRVCNACGHVLRPTSRGRRCGCPEPSDSDTATDTSTASDSDTSTADAPAEQPARPFTAADAARSFVLGGKAIFTLVSEATGTRYTYRVAQGKPRPGDSRPAPWFVSLLTGPDNTSEYTYLGMLDPTSGAVRVTRASRYTAETVPVRALDWCMRIVFAGRVPAGVRMYHCGRCGRCGRLLTVPSSIESGFGPECMARMQDGAQ